MTIAFIYVAVLLLIGNMLRDWIGLFRLLFIPVSVIGGLVGLAVIQTTGAVFEADAGSLIHYTAKVLSSWPSWLIAVVFAGMLLARKPSTATDNVRRVAAQGVMVWVIVLGEAAIGLIATWLLIQPFFDVPNSFGMLIETGFAGGHGTAAAMGDVFAHPSVQLESGRDLGMLMATIGLIYGIVTGVFWINVGVRKGWVANHDPLTEATESDLVSEDSEIESADEADSEQGSENNGSVDPLLLQVIWLALAVGLGMFAQYFVLQLAGAIDSWLSSGMEFDQAKHQLSKRLTVSNLVDFPLFVYTLFGGLLVRRTVVAGGKAEWIDSDIVSRLTAIAMDVLVVAAIATLNLAGVVSLAGPFLILLAAGAVWTAICLLFISKWLLPNQHWFQLGLINYGMSTGTTATGFVLLKMVDPGLKSDAAQDYALAAPLSAPFVGGGIITIALPLLLLERVPIAIPALAISGVVMALIFVGRKILK